RSGGRKAHPHQHLLQHAPPRVRRGRQPHAVDERRRGRRRRRPGVVGWLNTRLFDETGDEQAAQGWTPLILDTNGNGRRDAYVEGDQPLDPTMDKRIVATFYGIAVAPDGIVWGSTLSFPGALLRLDPGPIPTETALVEYYEVPWDNPQVPNVGFSPRG